MKRIAIVLLIVARYFGTDLNAPSQEDYVNDQQAVMFLTGQDEVTWTQSGNVFHLCQEASDINRESKDGQIFVGTTQQAVAERKSRLTKKLT